MVSFSCAVLRLRLPSPKLAAATAATAVNAVHLLPALASDNENFKQAQQSAAALPPDSYLVAAAVLLLLLTALLNLSLGDVVADEANLPSTSTRINQMKRKRADFIKSGTKPR